MESKRIKTALVSVYSKEGLEPIVRKLQELGVDILSTGGTQAFIEKLGVPVKSVEALTGYPSILDGRVKTLHPKVFGGILARREEGHLGQLQEYDIPEIDLVIVDLYPFEETVAQTSEESKIIEKIDIGGISLIRAAAKNYKDVVVVASKKAYADLLSLLETKSGSTDLDERKAFAQAAFGVSAHYDSAIFEYFSGDHGFGLHLSDSQVLRYGENPHQKGVFYGDWTALFDKLGGKELSYNNLVDVDAAMQLMAEFKNDRPTFAVLKHTNPCGVATRDSVPEAWKAALAGDPISAFGGILITNSMVDLQTAQAIDEIFYEVLAAKDFSEDALAFLSKKKKRILLKVKDFSVEAKTFKRLLNGVIEQDVDYKTEGAGDLESVTNENPSLQEIENLLFANKCVKHLKSNAIAIVKDNQLIGMGCGQTSRVDALKQAVSKAKALGFELNGAVLASDAFFPFADSVELAHQAGISAIIQPGGSIKDKDSIDYCNQHGLSMVMTGNRHFKH